MLRHALLLAFRNFLRYRSTFLINLVGLSTALFCTLMIYLWVHDELSFDQFHKNGDRLFVVMKNAPTPNGILTFDETPGLMADVLPRELPEVESAAAVIPAERDNKKGFFIIGNENVEAKGICASNNFFNVFTFPLTEGDKGTALSEMNNIVISKELSMKLFHTAENVIGRQLEWNGVQMTGSYVVAGVFDDLPASSSFQFDVLFNYHSFLARNEKLKSWRNGGPTTYVVLKKGVNEKKFNQKIADYLQQKGAKESLFIQKFADRYLHGQYENGVPRVDDLVMSGCFPSLHVLSYSLRVSIS
jgi:putative ABC transport system permease protein